LPHRGYYVRLLTPILKKISDENALTNVVRSCIVILFNSLLCLDWDIISTFWSSFIRCHHGFKPHSW